jgi:hypothetical protein
MSLPDNEHKLVHPVINCLMGTSGLGVGRLLHAGRGRAGGHRGRGG